MAVAIAQELVKQNSLYEILFVGTEAGLESRIVPPLGFPLKTIEIGGLKNVGLMKTIRSLLQIPASFWKSLGFIKGFNPDITVGVGGYASGPVILAARVMRSPSVIIEPNVQPGLTNRLLSPFVQGAMVAFSETADWFGKKARITGIPIREEFYAIQRRFPEDGPLRILIFGGSRGSHPINLLLIEAAPHLSTLNVSIIHQTGPEDHEMVQNAYQRSGIDAEVLQYIDEMPHQFGKADLIISRSGASTIAEITAAGVPALLIPFPHATDDHQKKNAETLANKGAAILTEQSRITGESLASQIDHLNNHRAQLKIMSDASRALARPDSTTRIIEFIKEIAV